MAKTLAPSSTRDKRRPRSAGARNLRMSGGLGHRVPGRPHPCQSLQQSPWTVHQRSLWLDAWAGAIAVPPETLVGVRMERGSALVAAYRHQGRGRAVPITFDDDMPLLEGRIDGVTGLIALDTGNSSTMVVQSVWARKHGLAERLTYLSAGSRRCRTAAHRGTGQVNRDAGNRRHRVEAVNCPLCGRQGRRVFVANGSREHRHRHAGELRARFRLWQA